LSARESSRWLETAEQAKAVLPPAAVVPVVDDREGISMQNGPCFRSLAFIC
jgi:hypothetical protein